MSKLNDRDIDNLESLGEVVDENSELLTPWELEFAEGIIERFDKYGVDTIVSDKQWAVIMRILEKGEI